MDNDKPFQTRSEDSGMDWHSSMEDALEAAKKDLSIWKISFSVGREMVRLVKRNEEWVYEPIL